MSDFFDNFLEEGYLIQKVENISFIQTLNLQLQALIGCNNLEQIHETINKDNINRTRIDCFRSINKITEWEKRYFSLASKTLTDLLGPDISIQSKLNLSIQMPEDKTSILDLHTDALSGQSVFELVLWVPLTRAYETNSMYIFSRETTKEILKNLRKNEAIGMKNLFEKYKKEAKFLNLKYGECLIFSPTLFHGNILNKTNITRVSINCRFKNLFSHEAKNGERKLGSFYKVFNISPVTKLGLAYRDDLINF